LKKLFFLFSVPEMLAPNIWIVGAVVSPVLTFGITYTLAIHKGYIPTESGGFIPSATIEKWPNIAIGQFGMALSSWCFIHFFYLHHMFLVLKLPCHTRMTTFLYWLGEFCSFCIFALAVIPTDRDNNWHSFFAYSVFGGFLIWSLIITWYIDPRICILDKTYRTQTSRCWYCRRCLSLVGLVSFALFFIFNTPSGISAAEVIMIIGFQLWMLTLLGCFGDIRFKVVCMKASNHCSVQEANVELGKDENEYNCPDSGDNFI